MIAEYGEEDARVGITLATPGRLKELSVFCGHCLKSYWVVFPRDKSIAEAERVLHEKFASCRSTTFPRRPGEHPINETVELWKCDFVGKSTDPIDAEFREVKTREYKPYFKEKMAETLNKYKEALAMFESGISAVEIQKHYGLERVNTVYGWMNIAKNGKRT